MPKIRLPDGRVIDVVESHDEEGSFYKDPEGNYYPMQGSKTINPTISTLFNPPVLAQTGVKPLPPEQRIENWNDIIREGLKFARPVATGVGTSMGLSLPLPLPLRIGAGLGMGAATDIALQNVQKNYGGYVPPTLPSNIVPEPIVGAAENIGINELGGAFLNKLTRKFMPFVKPTAERVALFRERPEIPATFSQVAEGQGRILEDILGGKKREQMYKDAQQALGVAGSKLSKEILGEIPDGSHIENLDPYYLLNKFAKNTETHLAKLVGHSNKRFEQVRAIAKLPGNIGGGVEGPIYPINAVAAAKKFLNDNGYTGTVDVAKIVDAAEREMVRTAQDIVTAFDANTGKVNPFSYDYADRLKRAVGNIGFASLPAEQVVVKQKQRLFRNLYNALDNDIETSIVPAYNSAGQQISGWKTGGTDAIKAFREGNAIIKIRHDQLEQGDTISKFLKGEDKTIPMFDSLLSSEEQLNRALAVPGNRRVLGAYMIQKAMQKAYTYDKDLGPGFDSSTLFNEWKKASNIMPIRKLYTADQKAKIDNFFTVLTAVSHKPEFAGKTATAIRVGNAAIYVASGLLTGAAYGTSGPGYTSAAAITGGYIALDQFVKHVMLNPKVAIAATKLLKAPATSEEARAAWRTVAGALQGVSAVVKTQDGKEKTVTIGGDESTRKFLEE